MKPYQLRELAEKLDLSYLLGNEDLHFQEISFDTRRIVNGTQTLFIALSGPHHDGHDYLKEAWLKGVRQFIVEKDVVLSEFPESLVARVGDSRKALQKLASIHRSEFSYPVIGITGSNGKTVVKEWLNQLLAEDLRIVRSPLSYNSQVGVPLSLWNMGSEHQLGIFEAGISRPGEMDALETMIRPDIGLFLNVGKAHMENFGSTHAIASEKVRLFRNCPVLLFNADHPEILQALDSLSHKEKRLSWSLKGSPGADLRLLECLEHNEGITVKLRYHREEFTCELPMSDKASRDNLMAVVLLLLHLGYDAKEIARRTSRLSSVEMRLQVLEGIHESRLINDAYNSDVQALEIALNFLDQQSKGRAKALVLSDVLQSGQAPDELYREIGQKILSHGIDKLILIGRESGDRLQGMGINVRCYPDTPSYLKDLVAEDFREHTVLIKGAREFGFERIVKRLQEKVHDTVLEIDLGRMTHNLNVFRSRLKEDTALMVMVKAFSYGSGSIEVARLLEFQRVDALAVAYTDEGVHLRENGISLPIVVMNPERSSFDALIRYRLEPEIYSFSQLERFIPELAGHPERHPYPVHLKVDTGMHRLGFDPKDLDKLADTLKAHPEIRVDSVFSHLAASEDAGFDAFTREQISIFEDACKKLHARLDLPFKRHILNSAGILRFPEAHFEMVRLGIGLYGVDPSNSIRELQPVSTLKTVVSQVRELQPGESVGYSRAFVASGPTKVAVIPVGYADGLRRSMGKGKGKAKIAGELRPYIGNICMDMSMIDVTGLNVQAGDEVIVMGESPDVKQLGMWMDTIPYEVLTGIPPRVKRIFIQE